MVYSYTNARNVRYYLNSREVPHNDGTSHYLYFFSKDERDTGIELPEGFIIIENPKTGLPMVKKES